MQVEIPRLRSMEDEEAFMTPSSVKRVEKFSHQSQINKARCWESDPNLIAGRVDCGPICIFRRGVQYPETLLTDYNLASGFALEWTAYGLLTADYDGKIVFWENIEQKPQAFQYEDKVGEARVINRSTFCSVADDGKLSIWDFRTGKSETQVKASEKELNCCAVNPDNRSLILTGGDDTHIRIWDIRNPKQKLHYFDDHEGSILSLQWSPHTPSIFASGSQDKKVKIWDMLRVGFQIPKDNNGTGELLFTHEGHRGEVTDLDWNPYGMLLGSTQQVGNSFQIYEISNFIQQIEYAEDLNYLKQHCLA